MADITEHEPLIRSLLTKFKIPYQMRDDCMQDCYIALINAEKNFDNNRNIKFITYAYVAIVRQIYKFISKSKKDRLYIRNFNKYCYNNDIPMVDFYDFIDFLSEREKQVLDMYFIQKLKTHDIAVKIGVSRQTISKHIGDITKKINEKQDSILRT